MEQKRKAHRNVETIEGGGDLPANDAEKRQELLDKLDEIDEVLEDATLENAVEVVRMRQAMNDIDIALENHNLTPLQQMLGCGRCAWAARCPLRG